MRNGRLPDGREQEFYYHDDHPTMPGWFKGSEAIIKERGLWPEGGLRAGCEKTCFDDESNNSCCCRKLLFTQPDFVAQKSHLEEYITSRGHICDFYPKFHCELNFIEQYWGAVKYRYRSTPSTTDIKEMRTNVLSCLDDVPLLQIRRCVPSNFILDYFTDSYLSLRYANRAARFIHAYAEGLTGAQAAWANRKYHGHRVLPPEMLSKAREAL